jgi:hypothetical protein
LKLICKIGDVGSLSTYKLIKNQRPLFGGDAIGDACDFEENFDCDHDCDGTDAFIFKIDFGRSPFGNPCPICTVGEWCNYP